MMKKILLFIGIVLTALFVYAVNLQDGMILNQQQVNNFDMSTYDNIPKLVELLECSLDNDGDKTFYNGEWYYYKEFHCYTMAQLNETHYRIFTDSFYPNFKINEFRRCIPDYIEYQYTHFNITVSTQTARELCIIEFTNLLNRQAKDSILNINETIFSLKRDSTDVDMSEIDGGLW